MDTNGTYKDLLSTGSFKPRKNITEFESITDRKTLVSRDAQNVCAITTVGTALKLANIDVNVYQAHNTRSASTTKAATLLPIDVVTKLAGWSQESAFRKFYDKSLAITDKMSNAILNIVDK